MHDVRIILLKLINSKRQYSSKNDHYVVEAIRREKCGKSFRECQQLLINPTFGVVEAVKDT